MAVSRIRTRTHDPGFVLLTACLSGGRAAEVEVLRSLGYPPSPSLRGKFVAMSSSAFVRQTLALMRRVL